MFRRLTRTFLLCVIGFGLSACVSDRMAMVTEPPFVAAPRIDQATLVFLRSSFFGSAIQSSVFDVTEAGKEPQLVGIVSYGTKIGITVPAGERRFMVVSEAADFMDATLLPGKTYYTLVTPRIGMWAARFSLLPVDAAAPELVGYLKETKWVDNTPASLDWARANMPDIRSKQEKYLVDWLAKSDRPILPTTYGR